MIFKLIFFPDHTEVSSSNKAEKGIMENRKCQQKEKKFDFSRLAQSATENDNVSKKTNIDDVMKTKDAIIISHVPTNGNVR